MRSCWCLHPLALRTTRRPRSWARSRSGFTSKPTKLTIAVARQMMVEIRMWPSFAGSKLICFLLGSFQFGALFTMSLLDRQLLAGYVYHFQTVRHRLWGVTGRPRVNKIDE